MDAVGRDDRLFPERCNFYDVIAGVEIKRAEIHRVRRPDRAMEIDWSAELLVVQADLIDSALLVFSEPRQQVVLAGIFDRQF